MVKMASKKKDNTKNTIILKLEVTRNQRNRWKILDILKTIRKEDKDQQTNTHQKMGKNQNEKYLTEAFDIIEKNYHTTEKNLPQPQEAPNVENENYDNKESNNNNYVRRGGRKQRQKNTKKSNKKIEREKNQEIKCLYVNANGMNNKKTSLKIIMETTNCDIIFIDETKLHEYSAIPNFEGYTPIHEERKKKPSKKE